MLTGSASALRRLALALTLLATIAAGQAGPAAADANDSNSDLSTDWRLAYNDAIDYQANIFHSYDTTPYFIFTEVYDTLLNYDIKDGSPDLANSPADSYTESKDGLTITYHLRPNLRWSDGKPLTADDVVFSYEVSKHSIVNSDYTDNMASITALSPTTVQIKMKRPDARILSAYVPIVPKHIWGKLPVNQIPKFNPCCPMVGSGPFYVKSINPQGTTVLEPNPYFYGDKGQIKRILLIRYQDEESMLRDLKLGKVDAINSGPTSWVDVLRKDTNAKFWSSPGPGFSELAFNSCPPQGSTICSGPGSGVHTKVVQDPAIRQALQWAIDRNEISRVVYHNQATPGGGLISSYYQARGYFKDWLTDPADPQFNYTYDPDKARQILKDGGWSCPTGGICSKDGTKAEFTLLVLADASEDQQSGLRIQAWAKAVGIKIDVQVATEDAVNGQIYHSTSSKAPADSGKYEPTYDAFIWGWGGDVATPDYNFSVMGCGNWSADAQWCNPKFDKLAKEALAEPDFHKRVDMLHQAEKLELEASPYIIYAYSPYVSVTRTDTWHGYQPSPSDGGQPFGMSWEQLQLLTPGQKAGSNYAGTAWVIAFLVGISGLVLALGWWRRRREEHQPFEDAPGEPLTT
jgi:peptide/nickel transport system substrate-binding protein